MQYTKACCAYHNLRATVPSAMAQTHFERVVEEEKGKLLKSLVSISAAESHRIADVQGQYKGLETALKLYREAARIDIEADI